VKCSDYGKNDLFVARDEGSYEEHTDEYGLGSPYLVTDECPAPPDWSFSPCWLVSWGSALADFDLDGWRDLVVINHQYVMKRSQPTLLWRGSGPASFEEPTSELGSTMGLGLLAGDLDDDGDLELLLSGENARLVTAADPGPCDWLKIQLHGHASNPEGLGALVTVSLTGGRKLFGRVGTGGVVHSWPLPETHFSWCDDEIDTITVEWPSGYVQEIAAPPVRQALVVEEALEISVSERTASADGVSVVDIEVAPATRGGEQGGFEEPPSIETTAGTWEGDVALREGGRYGRRLVAPQSPSDALITISQGDKSLLVRPRIEFR
jgi:hypothetical protein